MTVVGNRVRIGGFGSFRVVEYDSGGGLPKKVVIWPEIGQKCGGFVWALILETGSSIGSGE